MQRGTQGRKERTCLCVLGCGQEGFQEEVICTLGSGMQESSGTTRSRDRKHSKEAQRGSYAVYTDGGKPVCGAKVTKK